MYKLNGGSILRRRTIEHIEDGAAVTTEITENIPADPLNRDYQQYLIDVENGATVEDADPASVPEPSRDERIITAAAVRKERIAAKKAAILASGLPTATKAAMADLLDGMSDIVDGLVEAIQGGKP